MLLYMLRTEKSGKLNACKLRETKCSQCHLQTWLWTEGQWISLNHRMDFCKLEEMFFLFSLINTYFSLVSNFLLQFHIIGNPDAFLFLFSFSCMSILLHRLSCLPLMQIILIVFFWNLFCLSWLKLCFSGLTRQPDRSELIPSSGRSAETPDAAQIGESTPKVVSVQTII